MDLDLLEKKLKVLGFKVSRAKNVVIAQESNTNLYRIYTKHGEEKTRYRIVDILDNFVIGYYARENNQSTFRPMLIKHIFIASNGKRVLARAKITGVKFCATGIGENTEKKTEAILANSASKRYIVNKEGNVLEIPSMITSGDRYTHNGVEGFALYAMWNWAMTDPYAFVDKELSKLEIL